MGKQRCTRCRFLGQNTDDLRARTEKIYLHIESVFKTARLPDFIFSGRYSIWQTAHKPANVPANPVKQRAHNASLRTAFPYRGEKC